jgi:hypothetical protein
MNHPVPSPTAPGFPAWWPLACLVVLALAPGCSGSAGAENQDQFVQFVDSRGIISYRYVRPKPPAPPQAAQQTRTGPDLVELQEQRALEKERQREEVRAYQEREVAKSVARRQEMEQALADDVAVFRGRQAERKREQEERQAFQAEQSRSAREELQKGWDEAARQLRESQEIDTQLRRLRESQEHDTQLWRYSHPRYGR